MWANGNSIYGYALNLCCVLCSIIIYNVPVFVTSAYDKNSFVSYFDMQLLFYIYCTAWP